MAKNEKRKERDAGTGRYVPKGTDKKKPNRTVTERVKGGKKRKKK